MNFNTSITDILKLHRSILTDLQKRLGNSQGSITLTTSGTSEAFNSKAKTDLCSAP